MTSDDEMHPDEIAFLRFLDQDIKRNPDRLEGFPEVLLDRLIAVTEGVEVDVDEPVEGPVSIRAERRERFAEVGDGGKNSASPAKGMFRKGGLNPEVVLPPSDFHPTPMGLPFQMPADAPAGTSAPQPSSGIPKSR